MEDRDVKRTGRRVYSSVRRTAGAAETRHAILAAARALFVARGYAATTVAAIAQSGGVSVDTVYASVGRKPALLRELVETSISGTDHAVPALERDYVIRIRDAATAAEKISIYAGAIASIQERLGPIFLALRDAAITDESCAALWTEISGRRAANMLGFAADLRSTGSLRPDLTDQQVADIVWSTNSSEFWVLLVRERGWRSDQFATFLADAWRRLLLSP